MGGPASSYATAGIAPRVFGTNTLPHHDNLGHHRRVFFILIKVYYVYTSLWFALELPKLIKEFVRVAEILK
jgi:hypothetical protein